MMAKGLSATQRTLRALREQGRIVDTCERWVRNPKHPAGGFRKDLFGFIDLISLDPERGIVAIQSCGQGFSEHVKKITDSECTEYVIEWLRNRSKPCLELWGWRKVKLKRGGKAMRWKPRIADFNWDGELTWSERK
jgi:hypothetical protein